MLNAVRDRNAIILGVLEVPKLQPLWTADGRTPEALRIRDTNGVGVEPAVLTWVLLAFDLFNATGELTLKRMFDSLERDHLAIAFTLLIRVAYGEHGLSSRTAVARRVVGRPSIERVVNDVGPLP